MNNDRKFIPRKGFILFLIFIPGILLFGLFVKLLWNAVLPAVLHVSPVSFAQALGILILSRILFGGLNKRHWGGRWRNEMRERFASMTPEERERFRSEWKDRCTRWRRKEDVPTALSE